MDQSYVVEDQSVVLQYVAVAEQAPVVVALNDGNVGLRQTRLRGVVALVVRLEVLPALKDLRAVLALELMEQH